jgi:predicted glycosyl hydrolase (DUF1957 family)
LLLAVISANGFAAGLVGGAKRKVTASHLGAETKAPAVTEAIPEPVWAHANRF